MMRYLALLLASLIFVSCQSVDPPTVTVTGSAVVEAEPDTIIFDLTASYVGETTEEARSVTSALIKSSLTLLANYGVSSEDVRTSYFSIAPYYTYSDGTSVLSGQQAVQTVTVSLNNIDKVGDVIERLAKMDGIEISGIHADKKDKSLETMKAMELAVHNAYNRATVYATAAGYMLGDLISLSDTDNYGEAKVYSVSSEAGTAFYSGSIEVRDDVSAVFSLSE